MTSIPNAAPARLRRVTELLPLAVTLLAFAVLWSRIPQSLNAGDEWMYSRSAFHFAYDFEIKNGGIQGHRLALIVPLALVYRIFGVGMLTTHLPPLLAAFLLILVVARAVSEPRARVFAAALALTCRPLLRATNDLYPDIVAAALMTLAVHLLIPHGPGPHGEDQRERPVVLAFVLFLAFLAKLTAYWVLPVVLLAFVLDVRRPDFRHLLRGFYLPLLAALIALGGLYLILCEILWDDPLARLHELRKLAGTHQWTWSSLSVMEQVERLSYGPLLMLQRRFGLVVLALAMAGLAFGSRRLRFWGVYLFCMLLIFWFGSTSLQRFEPLPLSMRMMLPVTGPLLILAAEGACVLTAALEKRIGFAFPLVLAVLLGITAPLQLRQIRFLESLEDPVAPAMEIVRRERASDPESRFLLIAADGHSPRYLDFFFEYAVPPHLEFVAFDDATPEALADRRVFLWSDRRLAASRTRAYRVRNYTPMIDELGYTERFRSGPLSLYEVDDPAQLLAAMERRATVLPGLNPFGPDEFGP